MRSCLQFMVPCIVVLFAQKQRVGSLGGRDDIVDAGHIVGVARPDFAGERVVLKDAGRRSPGAGHPNKGASQDCCGKGGKKTA